MNKKGNNSSSVNWKKIVGIIAAIVVIIILILSLVSCQKKASSDNKKDKKVEEKDKKPKKNDKDKLTFTDENVSYRLSEKKTTPIVSNLSNNSSTPAVTPVVQKYDTEVTINGKEVTLEYKTNEYQEEGAKYTNKKNSTIVSSGDVTDIKIYNAEGEEVSLNIDSPVGEYSVVYSYTNPDGETVTASRTVTIEDTTAPTITYSSAIEGNTAVYTITVTDNSEIGSVDVDGTVLTAENNQYKFTATENKTYKITAKDIYKNTSTDEFTVSEIITPEELDDALTVGDVTTTPYIKSRTLTPNGAKNVRYFSTRYEHSGVDENTFKDDQGNYRNSVRYENENPKNRQVSTVSDQGKIIYNYEWSQGQIRETNYYYVYYEYTNNAGATATNVKPVDFN